MKLKPGYEDEYKKRHDEIWPDLKSELIKSGILKYHIFLDEETGILFAYQELVQDHTTDDLKNNTVVKKWWEYMKDIMETNPDNSPVVMPLKNVFDLK